MTTINLAMTTEQAQAVNDALDFYSRICTGQFEEIVALARFGVISQRTTADSERKLTTPEINERMLAIVNILKEEVGQPQNGSFGIGHPHVHLSGKRAWEARKALAKVLAELRDPNPSFKGVNYDGNLVRYTDDPEPLVTVVEQPKDECDEAPGLKL